MIKYHQNFYFNFYIGGIMKTYTIRELSEMFDLPASTLRYYESEGLLPEVPKSPSGQRIYNNEHIERLKCINCFKRTGMTISQLRKFFIYETDEAAHIDEILSLLKDQEQIVQEKLVQLQKDSAHVHHKVEHYSAIKHALENNLPMPTWVDAE